MEHLYSKHTQTGKPLSHTKHIGKCLGFLALLTCLSCDPVERDYSGTFREVTTENNTDGLMAIEFFRLGDDAMGLIRQYRSALSDEPFTKEIFCEWTTLGESPDENGNISLTTAPDTTTAGFTIKGKFINETTMEVTLDYGDGEPIKKTFTRVGEEPSKTCNTIKPYLINPQFEFNKLPQIMPAETSYTLRRPVFVTLWLSVSTIKQNDAFIYVGKQSAKPFLYLNERAHQVDNGIKGDVSLSILKPDNEMLIGSGQTRYALAHFVVIDDACEPREDDPHTCKDDPPERFSWDLDTEPIIATSLEFGIEQSEDFPKDANGLGKAIFFVEGRLNQLHPSVQDKIVNIDLYDSTYDNKHFYIVDVFFKDDAVVGMRLPNDPNVMGRLSYREVQLKLTRDYLKTTEILLPRLLTLENL